MNMARDNGIFVRVAMDWINYGSLGSFTITVHTEPQNTSMESQHDRHGFKITRELIETASP
jgi:hypothetical protein